MESSEILKTAEQSWTKIMFYWKTFIKSSRFGLIFLFLNFYIASSQQTFQRWFSVAFRLKWRHDVAQRQINVETTLRTSRLKSTTFNNVVYFKVELSNVRQRRNKLSFSTSILATLGNFETTLRIWPFQKNKNKNKNK